MATRLIGDNNECMIHCTHVPALSCFAFFMSLHLTIIMQDNFRWRGGGGNNDSVCTATLKNIDK